MSSTAFPSRFCTADADLPQRLAAALANWRQAAPASHGTRKFAPELSYGRHFGPAPATARHAAVIALLFRRNGQWHVPLTQRPDTLRHGGQISLPGGALEAGENSAIAVQRELAEELGIEKGVELLGQLRESYVYVSDFVVTPWLAVTSESPTWRPHAEEVARVVELPLHLLLDDRIVSSTTIQRGPVVFRATSFHFNGDCIWGATAIILAELADILRKL